MKIVYQPVMIRWHRQHGVMLFLPDMPANSGNIVCYAHVGQHSEASMTYYRETQRIYKAPTKQFGHVQAEAHALFDEYSQRLDPSQGEVLKVVERDTPAFQRARWEPPKPHLTPPSSEAEMQAYERYFDDCEAANKIPLCYDKWKERAI